MEKKTLSIIIPTYNEASSLTPLVENLHQVLAGYSYEVIFVDDNSPDGTAELAQALAARYPVRVLVRRDKRGLASAVVDGLGEAQGEVVGVMDADLQHPPEVIPELVKEIQNGADIAIASRYIKGGGWQNLSLIRRAISKGAILIAHLLLPSTRQVSDPMSGFFLFKKAVVAGTTLKPTGYKILLEILTLGKFEKIAEVPYSFQARRLGASKLGARQQIDYLKHVFSLMRRKGELLRFIKFCLVGASGILVNMGLLWLLTELAGLFYLLSAAISIETSIITNFILNDRFTFPDRRSPGAGHFLRRLLKFNIVSLAGLGINLGVLWLLTSVLGIYYLLSNLCGIAAATLWNYLANIGWTWR